VSRSLQPGEDLDRWLTPFLDVMGRSTRRRWGPLYVRGLLGPDGPKSVQPIAARLGLRGHDQLHHFVSSAAWDDAPLWRVLAEQADRLVGGPDAVLVIDDTGVPKKGTLSVGVAAQYCGELGKQANCQSLVSLTLARHEVPVPVGLRLFLPKAWTDDPARCGAAGVPEAARAPRTKPEIALSEIDRVAAAGIRFGCVLADAGYGLSAPFRQGLSTRGLTWSVGIPRTQKVYTPDVRPVWPDAGRGRPRKQPVPSEPGRDAASTLANCRWRRIAWRQGTKGTLAARFAAMRVQVADGPTVREGKHLPGEEAWLIGEWRSSGERKFYLSNQPPRTSLRTLAATIKARWVCEQAHQQLKQELGLGAFEGRSWTGLHRHALMSCIAFAYLQHLRLKLVARRGEKAAAICPATETDAA
jgi:SRSO17 transposase